MISKFSPFPCNLRFWVPTLIKQGYVCINALLLWQISLKGKCLQTKSIKEKIQPSLSQHKACSVCPPRSSGHWEIYFPGCFCSPLPDTDYFIDPLWEHVFKPLFKPQKWRFPLSLQFISSPESSWVTAATTLTAQAGTLCCCQPSSAPARYHLYMQILSLLSKTFTWPKKLHYSSCRFLPCSCPVRCIINCLHPPSHPSPTTIQQNCQIRFIAIQL